MSKTGKESGASREADWATISTGHEAGITTRIIYSLA